MIRHVGISVASLARSLEFYEGLGFKRLFEIERQDPPDRFLAHITGYDRVHIKIAMLRRGEATLELLEYLNPRAVVRGSAETFVPGNVHFCLTADKELYAAFCQRTEHIIGHGCIPDGPQAGARVYYFRGPDGETIELFLPPELFAQA